MRFIKIGKYRDFVMATLILYGTTYGCTEKCAFKLADYIAGDVKALNLEGNNVM